MLKVLVTGAKGQLGKELEEEFVRRPGVAEVFALSSSDLDITSRDQVLQVIWSLRPDLIVNSAAMTAVDLCEDQVDHAMAVNALGVRNLKEAAIKAGSSLCHFSTDYIFDGRSESYDEWASPNPLNVYGMSKLAGEHELDRSDLLIRTSWVMGRYGSNIVKTILKLADQPNPLRFVADQVGSPTVASDLAKKTVEMCLERRVGTYHVSNQTSCSWYELARFVLSELGTDPERVIPINSSELPDDRRATRPMRSVLNNSALRLSGSTLLPDWQESVGALVRLLSSQDRA